VFDESYNSFTLTLSALEQRNRAAGDRRAQSDGLQAGHFAGCGLGHDGGEAAAAQNRHDGPEVRLMLAHDSKPSQQAVNVVATAGPDGPPALNSKVLRCAWTCRHPALRPRRADYSFRPLTIASENGGQNSGEGRRMHWHFGQKPVAISSK
jgi:hypothetical protein